MERRKYVLVVVFGTIAVLTVCNVLSYSKTWIFCHTKRMENQWKINARLATSILFLPSKIWACQNIQFNTSSFQIELPSSTPNHEQPTRKHPMFQTLPNLRSKWHSGECPTTQWAEWSSTKDIQLDRGCSHNRSASHPLRLPGLNQGDLTWKKRIGMSI